MKIHLENPMFLALTLAVVFLQKVSFYKLFECSILLFVDCSPVIINSY